MLVCGLDNDIYFYINSPFDEFVNKEKGKINLSVVECGFVAIAATAKSSCTAFWNRRERRIHSKRRRIP